jgi:hypothetical protein
MVGLTMGRLTRQLGLHLLNIITKLSDFDAQADALPVLQAQFRVAFLQKSLQLMRAFFQIDPPPLVFFIKGNIDIDAALADIRIKISNFLAKLVFIYHG